MNVAEFSTKSVQHQAAMASINRLENSMGFVNELISEEDKSRLNPELYKSRLGGYSIRLWKWTIDREQEAFLLRTDGGREDIPEFYILTWREKLVKFAAYREGAGNNSVGVELKWRVFQIDIPLEIRNQREDVLRLIREALRGYGWGYDTNAIKSVDITIEQEGGVK
jgi:hypothetical protein